MTATPVPAVPTCAECGARYVVVTGQPTIVSFGDALVATVRVDTNGLDEVTADDVYCECDADVRPTIHDEALADLRLILAAIAARYAPELDCDLPDFVERDAAER